MPLQTRSVVVFGPAYRDRMLRFDMPLTPPGFGPSLDGSVDGHVEPGEGLTLVDPSGGTLRVDPPIGWPGPWGRIRLSRDLTPGRGPWTREVRATGWQDDLGGMGPGYAAALGGELVCVLGNAEDPVSGAVASRLATHGIAAVPIRVDCPADWTLLLTSGPHGDKLPIGFRGCHAGLATLGVVVSRPCDLRVVASLPNRLAAEALRAPGAKVRMFAPALRNMLDDDPPLAAFADRIDLLSCNRGEWETLPDRVTLLAQIPAVAITDGSHGATLHYKSANGPIGLREAAFPRASPPVDTNRAGEAFGSTLVASLLDGGWTPGPIAEGLAASAMRRASAAAALVLDRSDFGFPGRGEIDNAVSLGHAP